MSRLFKFQVQAVCFPRNSIEIVANFYDKKFCVSTRSMTITRKPISKMQLPTSLRIKELSSICCTFCIKMVIIFPDCIYWPDFIPSNTSQIKICPESWSFLLNGLPKKTMQLLPSLLNSIVRISYLLLLLSGCFKLFSDYPLSLS